MEQQPTDAFGYFWFRFQAPGSIGARDDTTKLSILHTCGEF